MQINFFLLHSSTKEVKRAPLILKKKKRKEENIRKGKATLVLMGFNNPT